ncbi:MULTISPECIES: hypothetical protein [Halorubrum]|uniref:Uncharacterized protein n=1 Tax=Halorubrum hochstenium ATCC 700873 TaxID=1227481 RepID=M0F777_9EURY|nr:MULTISPECIES: hypothetical protein [Halorubrum]ELZ55183.1 hypothetical protein C467_09561 [Halorubrum hochstenium ATCC 700873]
MTGYYDYVLGLIPAALIGVTAVLTLVGLSPTSAMSAGAAAAAAVMAHALFVRAPVTGDGSAVAEASRPGRGDTGRGGGSSA